MDELRLCVRKLLARAASEFVHPRGSDLLVEFAHIALEEIFAVVVGNRRTSSTAADRAKAPL